MPPLSFSHPFFKGDQPATLTPQRTKLLEHRPVTAPAPHPLAVSDGKISSSSSSCVALVNSFGGGDRRSVFHRNSPLLPLEHVTRRNDECKSGRTTLCRTFFHPGSSPKPRH